MSKFTTYGHVRDMGPIRNTREAAERDLAKDREGCRDQGGYSDRSVYAIDADGYLMQEDGSPVWPSHGRSSGAVKAR